MEPSNNENNDNKPVLTPVNYENKEEHHGILTIICVIVLCILVGVGAFFAYKHFIDNNDEPKDPIKEEEKKEEEKPQDDNDEKENPQDDSSEDDDKKDDNVDDDELSYEEMQKQVEEYKKKVHEKESANEKKIIEFIDKYGLDLLYYPSEINPNEPSGDLEHVAYWYVKDNHEGEGLKYQKEEFDKYFKNVFDIVPTKYVDIICHEDDKVFYYYKDGMFVYNENHGGHGASDAPGFIDYYIVDYKESNNQYIIKLIFNNYDEMSGYKVNGEAYDIIYGDDEHTINDLDAVKYFHEHIDKYKSKSVFEYTLEKKDASFILKSFKIVK